MNYKKNFKTFENHNWNTTSSFGCGKEYPAMEGSNTCTPLFSINRHYIPSNVAPLNKQKLKLTSEV